MWNHDNVNQYYFNQIISYLASLMHYGRYAFSKDYRSPTIIPRNPAANIGQRRGFSEVNFR
jgi:hypothetical protein